MRGLQCFTQVAIGTFQFLVPALRYLSGAGWDVNWRDAEGQTAHHKAAFLGYSAAVKTLLDGGGDPSVRDASGRSALDVARQWNKVAVAKMLEVAG
ncbi:MAG: ankyrin repeat domain-containing protein [Bryobacterales bacterium]|nr:ankyrin repeat domain-containing protein [Bryobacterales bacterium]